MATINAVDTGEDFIEIEVTFSGSYSRIKFYLDGNYEGDDTSPSSPEYFTYSGLDPDTSYLCTAQFLDSSGQEVSSISDSFTTDPPVNPRPDYWEWSNSVLDNIYNNQEFNISASEWNSFLDNIKDVYNYKGWSLSSYPLTDVYSGEDFLADYFNEAKDAIGSKNATGISNKYPGDNIIGNDFLILRDKLNEID